MIAGVATAYVTMHSFNEVPVGFPASVLWQFRLASAGTQVTLWGTLGVVFGPFTQRSEAKCAASR